MKKILLGAVALAALTTGGCVATPAGTPAIQIGGTTITESQLDAQIIQDSAVIRAGSQITTKLALKLVPTKDQNAFATKAIQIANAMIAATRTGNADLGYFQLQADSLMAGTNYSAIGSTLVMTLSDLVSGYLNSTYANASPAGRTKAIQSFIQSASQGVIDSLSVYAPAATTQQAL